MEKLTEGRPRAISFEAKFVFVLAMALVLGVVWLLCDREPTHKEMTFAYRKSVIAASGDRLCAKFCAFSNDRFGRRLCRTVRAATRFPTIT